MLDIVTSNGKSDSLNGAPAMAAYGIYAGFIYCET